MNSRIGLQVNASICSRCAAFLVMFFLAAAPVLPQSQAQADLLSYLSHWSGKAWGLEELKIGSRAATVNVLPLLDQGSHPFRLQLPDGRQYLVTGSHEVLKSSRVYTWHGTLWSSDERQGQIVISVKNGSIAGKIYAKGATYSMSPLGNDRVALSLLDDSEHLSCGVPSRGTLSIPENNSGIGSSPPSVYAYAEDGSVIDVLLFYTAESRENAGGRDQIEAAIRMAVSDANLAFRNSDVRTRLNIVGLREVEYEETGSYERDLDWLDSDDTVAQVRDELAADLVGMVVARMEDACGAGRQMNPHEVGPEFASQAFQVTKLSCLDNQTLVHEVGHNMGAQHNVEDSDVGGDPAFPYGYGHYVDGSFRTIMAYSDPCTDGCRRIPHFSNPDVNFDGESTGVSNERDNHRLLNQTAIHVANFRVPLPRTPENVQASDGNHVDRVRITWSPVERAERYTLYRSSSATATKTVIASSLTTTSFDDTSSVAETRYYYWVKALNSAGSSEISSSDVGYRRLPPPTAPTGVSATDGSYTDRVRVAWSIKSGVTYSVFRATSTGGVKTTLATSLMSSSFDDTSAVAGEIYYYWVRASNSTGSSDFSAYDAGFRAVAPPAAPTGVSASDGTYSERVQITWNVVTGASRYLVYRATSTGGAKTVLASSLTTTSFDDVSAVAGTTYYYWVKATNSAGSSDLSTYNTGYRSIAGPPAAPAGVSASDGTYVDRVRITWNAVPGVSRYLVYRATSTSGTKTVLANSLTATSFDDNSAVAGTTYYYWVKATNSAGSSSFSAYNTGYRRKR